jgi:hypothetical protein
MVYCTATGSQYQVYMKLCLPPARWHQPPDGGIFGLDGARISRPVVCNPSQDRSAGPVLVLVLMSSAQPVFVTEYQRTHGKRCNRTPLSCSYRLPTTTPRSQVAGRRGWARSDAHPTSHHVSHIPHSPHILHSTFAC